MAEIVDRLHHESVTYGNGFAIKSETDFANCTGKITAVKIKTNADRIRQMTDEELAEMLCSGTCKYCHSYNKDCDILEWLRKEAEDG